MDAADWADGFGSCSIQPYTCRNQYGLYHLCGFFRTQRKKSCSYYRRNAGFNRCTASYRVQVSNIG